MDDRILVAFVDGELDTEESLAVHLALRRDPSLRERVRVMRESAALLRAAYGDVAREPLPPALIGVIRTAAGDRRRARFRWLPGAIAATVALAMGLSAGSMAPRLTSAWQVPDAYRQDPAGGPLALLTPGGAPEAVLHRTLERERSGTSVAWTDPDSKSEVTVEPLILPGIPRDRRDPESAGSHRLWIGVPDRRGQVECPIRAAACRPAGGPQSLGGARASAGCLV